MSMRKIVMAALMGASLVSFGCATSGDQAAGPSAELAAPRFGTWGFDETGRDLSVKPGDDFFRYAVGKAYDALEIPQSRSSWGPFTALSQLSDERSRQIIEDAAQTGGARGEAAQIGGLYRSFMDVEHVNALDAAPLKADLDAIRAADDRDKLAALMGQAPSSFYSAFFAPFVFDDQKDTRHYTVYLNLDGLGLPDRDYYLDAAYADEKAAYRDYVARSLKMIGWPDADKQADAVVDLETRIAKVSWTRAERRDDEKMYNPRTVAELTEQAPGFPWKTYFDAAGLGGRDRFVVGEVTAFPKVADIFARADIPTLQAWQAFRVVDSASPYLSDRFYDSYFDFKGKTLSGVPKPRERWERGVRLVQGALGEAIGKRYVAEYFPPQSKAQMDALVTNLRAALKGRIEQAAWMSPQTKAEALNKLSAITQKIGYPVKWRSYRALRIDPEDLYGNVRRSNAFDWNYDLHKLGRTVDRREWDMTPQTVNAYYNSTKNEVVFPAAILQPPFFDPNADLAVNYGAIGAVIGHEITHGFDDQGRKSDANGLLRDWWTPADAERFEAQAATLGAQYAAFEPVPGVHIKPEQTMGENIADLGGLLIAYDAYHLALGGREAPVIDGLTGDQRFFLAFAQVWLSKEREDYVKQLLVSDVHSPDIYRPRGVLPNVDAFYAAFNIQPGDAMYIPPEKRARIW